jgi:anti-sigma factor RsiW
VLFYETGSGGADLPGRLARNTLVWSRGPVTLRVEGDLSREEAERIARSVR